MEAYNEVVSNGFLFLGWLCPVYIDVSRCIKQICSVNMYVMLFSLSVLFRFIYGVFIS